jgi:signal transduction histidine kinase
MHALRTPLTVAMLRAQILRRHLRRGDELPSLETELDQIETTLAELARAIDHLDRNSRHG